MSIISNIEPTALANVPEAGPKFDQLCMLCSEIFGRTINLHRKSTMPHLDIYSLSRSAEKGCHLCSLILAEIHPEIIVHLKHDLDKFLVNPLEQITIIRNSPLAGHLKICAQSPSDPPRIIYARCQNYQYEIGHLTIRHVNHDYTQQDRSPSRFNYSKSTVEQIAQWLGKCIRTHSECFAVQTVTATRDILPTRLLDLRNVEHCGQLRPVATKDLSHDTIYATLSHCWGGQCQLRLMVDNLPILEAGIAMDCLPKTFRDAASVTVDLGIRYLWIDALCIVQDSKDDEDWLHEASIMGDVYANSYVTLAASTSPNSSGGLVHPRNPLAVWPCRLAADQERSDRDNFVVGGFEWIRDQNQEPLINRAWAFQEWLLSKRLIHFSHDQVRWECFCLAASEVYPEGLNKADLEDQGTPTKSIIPSLRNEPDLRQILWERIRTDYSEKILTKPGDRLIAFSGIARLAHKVLESSPQDYLAGLWKPEILQELLWTRYTEENQPRNTSQYIAPTWSWASLNGPFWTRLESDRLIYHAKIMDAKIVPAGDVFGPIKSAKLVMQCSLFAVTLSEKPDSFPRRGSNLGWIVTAIRSIPTEINCSLYVDYGPTVTNSHSTPLSFCYALIASDPSTHSSLPRVTGLLLQKCSGSKDRYIRVGVLEIFLYDTNRDRILTILNLHYELETRTITEGVLYEPRIIEIT